jgi:hypothetical protein
MADGSRQLKVPLSEISIESFNLRSAERTPSAYCLPLFPGA